MAKLWNKTKNLTLAENVEVASNMWTRARGLLGRKELPETEALWILRCNSIHTFFMRFPIDVAFVSHDLVVKKVATDVRPGSWLWPVWSARHVFEFAAGTLREDRVKVGDQLHVDR